MIFAVFFPLYKLSNGYLCRKPINAGHNMDDGPHFGTESLLAPWNLVGLPGLQFLCSY